jgi:RHS repeat-associated protein
MLGSTRTVVTAAGANAEGYTYYPYGLLNEGLSANFGATKEGFTGKERDAETALSYFGARYYMPALGRWGAVDPLADEYPGWSGYGYVMGDPAGMVDPDGLSPCSNGAESTSECIGRLWEEAPADGCPDCALDAAFLAADLNDIRKNGLTFGRAAVFGADLVLAAIPFAPAATGSIARFLGRAGEQVLDLALRVPSGTRKGSQMVARFRNATGSTGGLDDFLGYARGLAEEAFQNGDFVTGTVGAGANALENATIFRRGDDFLVTQDGVIRSFVPGAGPGGIRDFLRLGGGG